MLPTNQYSTVHAHSFTKEYLELDQKIYDMIRLPCMAYVSLFQFYILESFPPATTMVSPVMYEASSLHKNEAKPETSSGSPSLTIKKLTIIFIA